MRAKVSPSTAIAELPGDLSCGLNSVEINHEIEKIQESKTYLDERFQRTKSVERRRVRRDTRVNGTQPG